MTDGPDKPEQIDAAGQLMSLARAAAHDLRSPLGTISTLSQLLEIRYADALDERGLDCLQMMQRASARMRRLVDGLVLYAETCAGTVEPARFAAGAALAESINKLENEMGIAKAAVVAPAPLPHVVASQADLELIFDQLIGNAIVHRGSSPPHINIVAEADGAQVRFAVSDNGPGIAAEYHEFIFEPLKRLQPPEVSGSGLGLAIARRLVLRNGGRLWVESETGRGSSFIFTLPA